MAEFGDGSVPESVEKEKDNKQRISYHDHSSKLLKKLNETRKCINFCDTTVSIGNKEIPVQKGVLSAASQYFRALFNYGDDVGPYRPDFKSTKLISLDSMGIDMATFNSVLDYIYTAEVTLSPDNIQDMLQAADQLLMGDLKELCCEYLDSCITTSNCIGIFDFTSQLSCSWSHHKVSCFLDRYFREVSHSEEFLALTPDRVGEFLSRKTIQMSHEDDVLEALLRWYHHDPSQRSQHVVQLLKDAVFVKQLSEEAMKSLEAVADIGPLCLAVIEAQMKEEEDTKQGNGSPSFTLRGYTPVIVTCGGDGQTISSKEDSNMSDAVHCIRLDKSPRASMPGHQAHTDWIQLAPLNAPRTCHGLVEVGGCLYIAGGRDQDCRILNTCEKYDPSKNEWTEIAPMSHARVGFGFVAIENQIYAIGGSNDITEPSTTMEVYDIFTNRWRPLPEMMMKRLWACYVAAGRKIYVLGGGIVEKFYDSVEVFDTTSFTWSAISPMRERRCDARAVAVGTDIYVFGGYRRLECPTAAQSEHNMKLCGMELYSEKNDFWMPVHSGRGSTWMCNVNVNSTVLGALFHGEDIYVVGEFDMDNDEVHAVRSYNRHTNSWECVAVNPPPLQKHYPCCLLPLPTQLLYKLLWEQDKLRYTDLVKARPAADKPTVIAM